LKKPSKRLKQRLVDLNTQERVNPHSFFDSLFIVDRVEKVLGDSTSLEVYLFAYLGCLLALYRNHPTDEWGYSFVGTKMGAPYSMDLEAAIGTSIRRGFLSDKQNRLTLTDAGAAELRFLSHLGQNRLRQVYLEASCSTLLSFPVGMIREGLFNEPGLKASVQLSSTRALLTGPALELVYEQFSELSRAVGVNVEDLMVPAVVWVDYLSRISLPGDDDEAAKAPNE